MADRERYSFDSTKTKTRRPNEEKMMIIMSVSLFISKVTLVPSCDRPLFLCRPLSQAASSSTPLPRLSSSQRSLTSPMTSTTSSPFLSAPMSHPGTPRSPATTGTFSPISPPSSPQSFSPSTGEYPQRTYPRSCL